MNGLIHFFYHRILKSFWFIPSVLSVLALVGTSFLNWLDRYLHLEPIASLSWAFTNSPEGARSVLSTIAGSSITVLGVILSTMVVVLTLASQQYGPRLVRNFIEDRPSQVVVGCFAGCFIYSIITLKNIGGGESGFQPHLSIMLAVILAVTCIGLLIYFVQHVSSEIQVQAIMRRVYRDLMSSIEQLFPEKLGEGLAASDAPGFDSKDSCESIQAESVGYVQSIEEDTIMELATENKLVLKLCVRPGDFVRFDETIIKILGAQTLSDERKHEIRGCFLIGTFPTAKQDVRFPIGQLEEIAIRALSPGINDPHTAIECLDYLTSAMAVLSQRSWPKSHRLDENHELRVIAEPYDYESLLRQAYQQIHHYGRMDVTIVSKLLWCLKQLLAGLGEHSNRCDVVRSFAEEIYQKSLSEVPTESDRGKVKGAYESLFGK